MDAIKYLIEADPDFKPELEFHLEDYGRVATTHSQIRVFCTFISRRLFTGNYKNAKKVFDTIEFLITSGELDKDMDNAIYTCFLESLVNRCTWNPEHFEILMPLLGPESLRHSELWYKVS